jgi:ABC-2 type transport system ATP-binding protein
VVPRGHGGATNLENLVHRYYNPLWAGCRPGWRSSVFPRTAKRHSIIHRAVNSIEIERLDVIRGGRPVLTGISLGVAEGTVTGLLGPSGSGKSTLIRSIVGVQRITSGSVRVLGLSAGSSSLRTNVGYVTQELSVYRDLTVRANLRYFAAVLGVDRGRVDQVLEDVSLSDRSDARVGSLSGGQQSRVSLATALLGVPRVLILDEPTAGLDPVLREDLWSLFHRLGASGVTLLISSHVMEEAMRCQRLLLLRDGRLLSDDTPDGLLRRTGESDMDAAFLHLIRQSEATA